MSGVSREGAAGWSAAAKAQEVRRAGRGGRVRRVLAVVGLDPGARRVEAAAGSWEAGAKGERMTAALLQPLAAKGWKGFYDRALPSGRANFDHVLVPPGAGFVVLVDSKLRSRKKGTIRPGRGARRVRLRHGNLDMTRDVRSILYEARVLGELVGVPVVPVMVVHSAPVAGGRFTVDGVIVIEAAGLVGVLRGMAGRPDPVARDRLAATAAAVLPRYVERGRT